MDLFTKPSKFIAILTGIFKAFIGLYETLPDGKNTDPVAGIHEICYRG